MKLQTVSKEVHQKLPQAGRIRIRWHGFWFRWAWRGVCAALRERRPDLLPMQFYTNMRLANARDITIGPVGIMVPCRWLEFPARTLHPKVFD
jgi:hypothetical protein